MTGSCILEEGGLSCWHMQGHTCACSPPFHSIDGTTSPHLSSESCHAWLQKKELPSSLLKFLFTELTLTHTHTHTWCVSVPHQWYDREDGVCGVYSHRCATLSVYECVHSSFVLLSPAIPLKFDWCAVIYSFHLVCLLYVCVSYYIARRPIVIIADPDMLRLVMVKEFNKFPNRMVSGITFTM